MGTLGFAAGTKSSPDDVAHDREHGRFRHSLPPEAVKRVQEVSPRTKLHQDSARFRALQFHGGHDLSVFSGFARKKKKKFFLRAKKGETAVSVDCWRRLSESTKHQGKDAAF